MIQIYRSINNLSRSRIRPRRSHCISYPRRRITYTRIFQIIRIKSNVIHRKISSYNRILKTDFLKCHLPHFYTFFNIFFPILRKRIINIKHDRFLGFSQNTFPVLFHIFRFQIPTLCIITSLSSSTIPVKHRHPLRKNCDTRICQTRTHRMFRQ